MAKPIYKMNVLELEAALDAAKSRIGELEQERGAEGTNWFPESFVAQLQEQLREATERCNHFCKMALVPDGTESRKEIIALQAQLAAVTQGRDRLNERIKNQSFSILDYQEEKDAREAFIAESREQQQAQITQLQARNSKLETALFSLRNESSGFLGMADQSTHGITNMRCLQRRIEEADAALIQSTEEPGQ